MHKKAEELSIREELMWLSVCMRFRCVCTLQMCARKTSHTARLFRQQSRASYMLALFLRAVLISSPDMWDWTRMHALVVMLRWTLYENVDSAKIKVPFYTTDIDISRVGSMHQHCIDKSIHIMNRYTPIYYHILLLCSIMPYVHQACIYLIINTEKTVILWNIITI